MVSHTAASQNVCSRTGQRAGRSRANSFSSGRTAFGKAVQWLWVRSDGSRRYTVGLPNVQFRSNFRIPSKNARHETISARGCDLPGYGANTNPAPTANLVNEADERVAVSTMEHLRKRSTATASIGVASPRALPRVSRDVDQEPSATSQGRPGALPCHFHSEKKHLRRRQKSARPHVDRAKVFF